jgi:hypothetical protein
MDANNREHVLMECLAIPDEEVKVKAVECLCNVTAD